MSKYLIQCQELMKQDTKWHKLVNVNVDQMEVFAKIKNVEIKINADVNANN